MKECFRNVFFMNSAPTPVVLTIDISTQMEPDFIKNVSFGSSAVSCAALED
jgi:hypothetical protein